MAYYDRLLTSANSGKVQLTSLLGNSVYPAFATLAIINPTGSGGQLGLGDSSMSALPADAFQPTGEFYNYPPMAPARPWQAGSIYLWFENAGQTVRVRGETTI
jgi:hypothetical protein